MAQYPLNTFSRRPVINSISILSSLFLPLAYPILPSNAKATFVLSTRMQRWLSSPLPPLYYFLTHLWLPSAYAILSLLTLPMLKLLSSKAQGCKDACHPLCLLFIIFSHISGYRQPMQYSPLTLPMLKLLSSKAQGCKDASCHHHYLLFIIFHL